MTVSRIEFNRAVQEHFFEDEAVAFFGGLLHRGSTRKIELLGEFRHGRFAREFSVHEPQFVLSEIIDLLQRR